MSSKIRNALNYVKKNSYECLGVADSPLSAEVKEESTGLFNSYTNSLVNPDTEVRGSFGSNYPTRKNITTG